MIKNIIFDLGKVMINWDLITFSKHYTDDPTLQNSIVWDIFNHEDWHTLDEGTISEEEAVKRFSKRLNRPIRSIENIIFEARKIMTLKMNTYKEFIRLKENYNLYCLSNMSHKSWEVIKQEHDFYLHFKDIIISAQEKLKKPDINIFKRAIDKFDINPEETIFIDDLKENIDSAAKLNIKGILFDESPECWKKIEEL